MRLPSDATLLVVDDRLDVRTARGGTHDDLEIRAGIDAVVDTWRSAALPWLHVVRTAHPTGRGDAPGGGLPIPPADSHFLSRPAASAFVETGLEAQLTERGCTTLVVCGFETDGGVEATVRHAADLGFRIFVVADACAARPMCGAGGRSWSADDVHNLALARMAVCGARVVDTRTTWIAAKSAGWGRR